jgi:hypothetical protein
MWPLMTSVGRALGCATSVVASWSRSSSCSGTSASRRRSAIWDANSGSAMPSTIQSGSSRSPFKPDAGRLVVPNPQAPVEIRCVQADPFVPFVREAGVSAGQAETACPTRSSILLEAPAGGRCAWRGGRGRSTRSVPRTPAEESLPRGWWRRSASRGTTGSEARA